MTTKKSSPPWRPQPGARLTPATAQAMLAAHAVSGLSAKEFCRKHDLGKQTIFYWRMRLSKKSASAPMARASFAKVTTRDSASPATHGLAHSLEATLANGTRVALRGTWDAAAMQEWLSALARQAC